jgi:Recombination endonuclease VII
MTPIVSPDPLIEWMKLSVDEKRSRLGLRPISPEQKQRARESREEARKVQEKIRISKLPDLERGRMSRYGLRFGQWARLFKKQESRCAICGTDKPGAREWHTDHCHTTGKVRGVLCQLCNNALGGFKDDVSRLQAAINYLLNPPFSEDV